MSNSSEATRCPNCGGAISAEAALGLCPHCLLKEASFATETGDGSRMRSAPPSLAALAAAFPQFEIIELIGQGGMGSVFKARQPKLDRFIALKILSEALAVDPSFAGRFTREGRLLARLSHPNIVSVHDFGQAGEFFYLVMEYVDGVNLRQAMQAGRFTPAQALAVVPQVCEALQYAHQEGVLHRDIKPENILLDARGRVKIADFGIAKLMGESRAEEARTGTGSRLGTPHYMAPEQIERPGEVDHRADIYSLGVVFYEMLTGELPLGRFAPPSEKSNSDPKLDDVVFRTLAKEPSRRPQSAGDVKTQVESASNGTGVSTPQPQGLPLTPVSCYLSTPEHLAKWYGGIYIYTASGFLSLNSQMLSFSHRNEVIRIPLSSITELSLGQYPWAAKPTGLDFISVTFEANGVSRQLLFTPHGGAMRSTFHTNNVVALWMSHLQDGIAACTGRLPPSRPARELLPKGSLFARAISFGFIPVLVGLMVFSLPVWHLLTEPKPVFTSRLFGAIATSAAFIYLGIVGSWYFLRKRQHRRGPDVVAATWPGLSVFKYLIILLLAAFFAFFYINRVFSRTGPLPPPPTQVASALKTPPAIKASVMDQLSSKVIELVGITNTARSLRIDTHSLLEPGERIDAFLRHPDGRVEPAIISTIIRRGSSSTARITVFNWNLPESISTEQATEMGARMQHALTERPITLLGAVPMEVFAVTNVSGGIFRGFLTFGRLTPAQNSEKPTATVRFDSVAEIPRSLIFHYDLSVPAGFLVLAGGISNDGSVGETTTCSGRSQIELGNNCIWSFPKGFGAQEIHSAALALTKSGGRGPIKVLQGTPSTAFSVTNEAREVYTGYFELLGSTNTSQL